MWWLCMALSGFYIHLCISAWCQVLLHKGSDVTHEILWWRFILWPYALGRTAWNTQEIGGLSGLCYELCPFPRGSIVKQKQRPNEGPSGLPIPFAEEPFEQDAGLEFGVSLRWWSWYAESALATFHLLWKPCDTSDNTESKKACMYKIHNCCQMSQYASFIF